MKKLILQGQKIGRLISYQSSLWDSESGKMKMGEAALVMAIISKAIEDLPLILSKTESKSQGIIDKTEREKQEGLDSKRFIFSKRLDICTDLIGLNPDYIREKIKIWMSQWVGDGVCQPAQSILIMNLGKQSNQRSYQHDTSKESIGSCFTPQHRLELPASPKKEG
jgi:hypothetical protein